MALSDVLVKSFLWFLGGVEIHDFIGEQPAVAVVDARLDDTVPAIVKDIRREAVSDCEEIGQQCMSREKVDRRSTEM